MTLTVLSAVVLLTTITAAQANQCPGGGACASNDESPNVVVSMLQTKLQINVPGSAAEEASSDAFSGETNLDEKALNVSTLHDPHAMLTELEDIAHSGETPAFDVVSQIKSLIEYEMKPGLANMRNLTTQDTLDFSDTIQLCNDQSKAKEDAIEADMQVVVNDARSLHAACRVSEKAMYEHNLTNDDSYCVELGKFLHDAAQLTLHIPPNARTRDASVQYVEQAGDTNMCGGSEVRGLADGCTAQEEGLRSKSDDCNTKQGSFEVDFCMWKTQLEANCETLDTCHATAVTAYDKHVAKTRTLMQKWDAESASLEKILCYCNAWLSKIDAADNRSQHNSTQFDVCKNESYTPLPVNYGTRPEKAVCLLTSVAKFPGTSGFITQEYNSFLDFVKAAVPCPQATTAAPTTAMPTTTQAAMQMGTAVGQVVAGGYDHTIFVKENGTVYTVGNNLYGQLGDGTKADRSRPVRIMSGVKAVAAGFRYTIFLKENGTVYTAGQNNYGQLGDGTIAHSKSTPVLIMSGVKEVAAGREHSIFLKEDGTVYAVGRNSHGQFGDGTKASKSTPGPIMSGVKAVAVGADHTIFLKEDGAAYTVGENTYGQLGDGTSDSKSSPQLIMSGVKKVAAGSLHTLFLKENGTVYGLGANDHGLLGDGTTVSNSKPVAIMNGVKQVACGFYHNIFLTEDGNAYTAGYNPYGQLGDGTTASKSTYVLIMSGVKEVAAGGYVSIFVKEDGAVYTVGGNWKGQLGDGTTASKSSPVRIMGI